MAKNIDLSYFYRDIPNASALSNVNELYKTSGMTKSQVKSWLKSQTTHQLYRQVRKKFPRNSYKVQGLNDTWQVDLCDVSRLKGHNSQAKYLLGAIDTFSRQAYVRPLRKKTGPLVAKAMESILKSNVAPYSIMSDKGREFTGRDYQKLMKDYNINYYTTSTPIRKAWIIERFWRTFLSIIYKYTTEFNTKAFVRALPQLVKVYNNRTHRSIGMPPKDVTIENQHLVKTFKTVSKRPKYKIGDRVRLAIPKKIFEKGYTQTFTNQIFTISEIKKYRAIPMYSIKDDEENEIEGTYYEAELQRIANDK